MLFLNFLGDTLDTRTPLRFTAVAQHGPDLDLQSDSVQSFISLLRQWVEPYGRRSATGAWSVHAGSDVDGEPGSGQAIHQDRDRHLSGALSHSQRLSAARAPTGCRM